MIKVDLITGFLGSGKTTFIKRYAKYFTDRGQRIGILVNDYGAVNVDAMLLQELEGEQCIIETVAGACDADCHKRRFKTKLIALGMSGLDRVIIEPSGVFDVDVFFDSLYEEPLDKWYEIGSVIAVVEACLPQHLSDSAEYLLGSQAASAGAIVLSKTDVADADEAATVEHIRRALQAVKCGRSIENAVIVKQFDTYTDKDFERIANSGRVSESYVKHGTADDSGFCSLCFMNSPITAQALEQAAKDILQSPDCGEVFRVKGFVRNGDGWLELNATKGSTKLSPIAKGQEIIIVIGENLNKENIGRYLY